MHGAACQTDLVANQPAAGRDFAGHPGTLDVIAVLDRHAGLFQGKMSDLLPAPFRNIEPRRHLGDDGLRERHQGTFLNRWWILLCLKLPLSSASST